MFSLVALCPVSVLLFAVVSKAAPYCNHAFTTPKATFDLSPLLKEDTHYWAKDAYYNGDRPFEYYFNVCADTEEKNLPLSDEDKDLCHGESEADTAAAYQIVNKTDDHPRGQCIKLGRSEEMDWQLIDGDDAALGVQLTYSGGESDGCETSRQFSVLFKCIEEGTSLPPVSSVVEEHCRYQVTVETIYGCPRQCHLTSHDHLCSGHGLCAIDESDAEARCFCNYGKGGANCEEDVDESTGTSATSVLIAFVIVLLLALLAVAAVLYLKIKKLNAEDNPYGAFEDQVPNTMSLNA